jgi:3-hydroxybutyryl-CoA dehydrogenase
MAAIGARRMARGRMSAAEAGAIVGRITPTDDLARLATCDLAIEAVPEILDVKREVFRRLDAALPRPRCWRATPRGCRSAPSLERPAAPTGSSGSTSSTPASVMRLVEVVQGERTSDESVAAGEAFVRALGKAPVRVQECPGFLVNRVLVRPTAEAYRLAAETGGDRSAADRAVVEGSPAPMGPFALGDLIGLDTLAHLRRHLEEAYGERFGDGGAVDREVAAGRLGAKSGAGFHDGDAPGRPADEPGRAVAERYYLAALDEARRCVDEGIAAAADVDPAMRYGCGWSEGPLEWGRERGLADDVRGN